MWEEEEKKQEELSIGIKCRGAARRRIGWCRSSGWTYTRTVVRDFSEAQARAGRTLSRPFRQEAAADRSYGETREMLLIDVKKANRNSECKEDVLIGDVRAAQDKVGKLRPTGVGNPLCGTFGGD